jgi:hypothetical protein
MLSFNSNAKNLGRTSLDIVYTGKVALKVLFSSVNSGCEKQFAKFRCAAGLFRPQIGQRIRIIGDQAKSDISRQRSLIAFLFQAPSLTPCSYVPLW